MPLILPTDCYASWLDVRTPLDEVEALVTSSPAHARHAFQVSTWVNSPAHDDAQCIAPLRSE
jgi:putative SOS response-associated peptidase YedK